MPQFFINRPVFAWVIAVFYYFVWPALHSKITRSALSLGGTADNQHHRLISGINAGNHEQQRGGAD